MRGVEVVEERCAVRRVLAQHWLDVLPLVAERLLVGAQAPIDRELAKDVLVDHDFRVLRSLRLDLVGTGDCGPKHRPLVVEPYVSASDRNTGANEDAFADEFDLREKKVI